MKARLLLLLSSLILAAAPAAAQRKAIMEGLAASNTAIFIDTTNARVGISTAIPQSAFHVNNGDIRITTTTGNRGIIFQDGTTQTTAVSDTESSVEYSSGTLGFPMQPVFVSSTTYLWDYSIYITSGTGATADTFPCSVNADATAGNYVQKGTTYPTSRSINNQGASASISLYYQAGGTIATGDRAFGSYRISTVIGDKTRISGNGNRTGTESSLAAFESGMAGFQYTGTGPFTFRCAAIAGYGGTWESIVTRVGAVRP